MHSKDRSLVKQYVGLARSACRLAVLHTRLGNAVLARTWAKRSLDYLNNARLIKSVTA